MKILQLCAIDVSVDALLKPLITSLMKEGHIVHAACKDTGKFEKLRLEGLHMIPIPIERKISLFSNIKTAYNLYALIKKEKYDVIHVHTPVAALLGRISGRLARIPCIIYTAHGFYFHEGMSGQKYFFFYMLEKIFARYFTDWLLLQSREDYDLCLEKKFKKKQHIVHISNGVEVDQQFNPAKYNVANINKLKSFFGITPKDIVFSFIGRMVKEKGIFELVAAFERLKKTFPNIKLILIGDLPSSERDHESYRLLKEKITGLDIINTGYRSDISELLFISDIFVLPSYREGLPRSIIEAMSMEKPIIASNIRGCREEVKNNENGFLVEKGNIVDLYEKMQSLIEDPILREKFGKMSRSIVLKSFDEKKVIQKQLDLFAKL